MERNPIDLYRNIPEADLLELLFLSRESIATEMSIYMTLLFGFLTVTYLVGSKLERLQAVALLTLYSFFSLWMAYSIHGATLAWAAVTNVVTGSDWKWTATVNLSFIVTCWIVSVSLFLMARRKQQGA